MTNSIAKAFLHFKISFFLSRSQGLTNQLILHINSTKKQNQLRDWPNRFFQSSFEEKYFSLSFFFFNNKKSTSFLIFSFWKYLVLFSPVRSLSFFLKSRFKIMCFSSSIVRDKKQTREGIFLVFWSMLKNDWQVSKFSSIHQRLALWAACLSKYQCVRLYQNITLWWFLYWVQPKAFDYSLLGMLLFWFMKVSSSRQSFFKYISCCFCLLRFLCQRYCLMSRSTGYFLSKKSTPASGSTASMTTSYRHYLVMLFYLYDSVQKELKQGYRAYRLISLGNRGKLCSLYSLHYWHNFVCFKVYKVFGWLFTYKHTFSYNNTFNQNGSYVDVSRYSYSVRPSHSVAQLFFILYMRVSSWYLYFYKSLYFCSWAACFHFFLDWSVNKTWTFLITKLSFHFQFFSGYMLKYLYLWSKRLRKTYGAFFSRQALCWRVRNVLNAHFSVFYDTFYNSLRFKYGWFKLKAKRLFRRKRWYRRYKYFYFYKKNVESISRKHSGFKRIPFAMRQKWRWKT